VERLRTWISILIRSIRRVHVWLDGSESAGKEKDTDDQDHDEAHKDDADETVPSEPLRGIFANHPVAIIVCDNLIRHRLLLRWCSQIKGTRRKRMSAGEQNLFLFS
jgi:hypothetical protein